MSKKSLNNITKLIVSNKKANFDYYLEEKYEAGVVLRSAEVKSIRAGSVSIQESYIDFKNCEPYIIGSYIAQYDNKEHNSYRCRKLLLHKKQIRKLHGSTKKDGYTIVPCSVYLNQKNIVKIQIALAKGKKLYDKRQVIKNREWSRRKNKMQLF